MFHVFGLSRKPKHGERPHVLLANGFSVLHEGADAFREMPDRLRAVRPWRPEADFESLWITAYGKWLDGLPPGERKPFEEENGEGSFLRWRSAQDKANATKLRNKSRQPFCACSAFGVREGRPFGFRRRSVRMRISMARRR